MLFMGDFRFVLDTLSILTYVCDLMERISNLPLHKSGFVARYIYLRQGGSSVIIGELLAHKVPSGDGRT